MHSVELAAVLSQCFDDADPKKLMTSFSNGDDCGFTKVNPQSFRVKLFRGYQEDFIFSVDRVVILNWARQIGKSTALSYWAMCRALFRPGHTVCVFSNTVKNGEEILFKIEDFIKVEEDKMVNYVLRRGRIEFGNGSRVVVLAASARTARGYSGDVILDEFAFYRCPGDLFGAVQPIISSDESFKMVVSSTPALEGGSFFETLCKNSGYRVFNCSRSEAYKRFGVPVYSEIDGRLITPEEAERESLDKAVYRASYELDFGVVRQRPVFTLADIREAPKSGELGFNGLKNAVFVGIDVGRSGDKTVAWGLSADYATAGCVVLQSAGIADQVNELLSCLGTVRKLAVDATGVGAGFADLLRRRFRREILPVHFGGKYRSRGVMMAMPFALTFFLKKNWKKVSIPDNPLIFNDLLIPQYGDGEKILTRRELGSHCDYFWALALANYAGMVSDRSISGRL